MRKLSVEEMELVSGGEGGADILAAVEDVMAHAMSSATTGDVSAANGNSTASGNSVSTGDIGSGNTTNVCNGSGNGNGNGLRVDVL